MINQRGMMVLAIGLLLPVVVLFGVFAVELSHFLGCRSKILTIVENATMYGVRFLPDVNGSEAAVRNFMRTALANDDCGLMVSSIRPVVRGDTIGIEVEGQTRSRLVGLVGGLTGATSTADGVFSLAHFTRGRMYPVYGRFLISRFGAASACGDSAFERLKADASRIFGTFETSAAHTLELGVFGPNLLPEPVELIGAAGICSKDSPAECLYYSRLSEIVGPTCDGPADGGAQMVIRRLPGALAPILDVASFFTQLASTVNAYRAPPLKNFDTGYHEFVHVSMLDLPFTDGMRFVDSPAGTARARAILDNLTNALVDQNRRIILHIVVYASDPSVTKKLAAILSAYQLPYRGPGLGITVHFRGEDSAASRAEIDRLIDLHLKGVVAL